MKFTMLYRLPALYGLDALARELDVGEFCRSVGRQIVMESTLQQLEELLDDARHYADPIGGPNADSAKPIVASAKRAIPHIEKAVLELRSMQR